MTGADLIAIHAGIKWIFGGQHGAADQYAQQDDVTVVRMIAQLVTPDTKPVQRYRITSSYLVTPSYRSQTMTRRHVTSSAAFAMAIFVRLTVCDFDLFTNPSLVLLHASCYVS